MNANQFNTLFEMAEKEMARLHPGWNPNSYNYLKEHARIMRRIAREMAGL